MTDTKTGTQAKRPPESEIVAWVALARDGDLAARDRLFVLLEKLIWRITQQFRKWPKANEDDLFQEGFLGLTEAIRAFNPTSNRVFISYAYLRIRTRMRNSILQTRSVVEVPINLQKYLHSHKNPDKFHHRKTSPGADGALVFAEQALCSTDSIGAREIRADREEFGSHLLYEEEHEIKESCPDNDWLDGLDDREREIIGLYFGFDPRGPLKNYQIASMVGLSPSLVSKIKLGAIDRIVEKLNLHPAFRQLATIYDLYGDINKIPKLNRDVA